MNKILRFIGWKDKFNRWDKIEMSVDIVVLTLIVVIAIIYSMINQ